MPPTYYEDGVHGHWAQQFWHRGRQRIFRQLVQRPPTPTTLIDLGCHSGWLSSQLQVWTGANVIGLDFAEHILAYGRQAHPNVEFRQADLEQPLPLTDQMAEMVTAFDVLEHLTTLPQTLHEVRRILKPGGQFICAIPSGRLSNIGWWVWTHRRGAVWKDLHQSSVTLASLKTALLGAGLAIEQSNHHFFGTYHVIVSRRI